ncbi:MAG TPA: ABC transporter ATP-binding protein [Anaerolineaceae bacterium]|nr:ABC transporter ATP-binding protein [Anaerolineaceae bacterium]
MTNRNSLKSKRARVEGLPKDEDSYQALKRGMMSIIRTENLTKTYVTGGVETKALDNVSIKIEPGEFVAIMGPSGCGKSTLLHMLGGLDRPSSGEVWINDEPISKMRDDDLTRIRRREIGFVFQFFNLIPVLSAVENAALPLRLDGTAKSAAEASAKTWLERFELSDRTLNRPDQLSGGQQQRVAIARALVAEPKLVLADEPTGNLDTHASEEIAGLLRQISRDWKRTVVMVTHDPRLAAYADRIIFLKDGKVLDDQALSDSDPNLLREQLDQYER